MTTTLEPLVHLTQNPLPNIGETIGIQCNYEVVPCKVTNHFKLKSTEGIKAKIQTLPKDIHHYKIVPCDKTIKGKKLIEIKDYCTSSTAFEVTAFSPDLRPTPEEQPIHTPEEEFAVLIAAACYQKHNWRDKLSQVWRNGAYPMFRFDFLCGELQRVRNKGGWDFVDQTIEKNPIYIEMIRIVLHPSHIPH